MASRRNGCPCPCGAGVRTDLWVRLRAEACGSEWINHSPSPQRVGEELCGTAALGSGLRSDSTGKAVQTQRLAAPPVAAFPLGGQVGEVIAVEDGPHVLRRLTGERVFFQQSEHLLGIPLTNHLQQH